MVAYADDLYNYVERLGLVRVDLFTDHEEGHLADAYASELQQLLNENPELALRE